jgi:hypothetical protein
MQKFTVLVIPVDRSYFSARVTKDTLHSFVSDVFKSKVTGEFLFDTRIKPNEINSGVVYDIYMNPKAQYSELNENTGASSIFNIVDYFFGTVVVVRKEIDKTKIQYKNVNIKPKSFKIKGTDVFKYTPTPEIQKIWNCEHAVQNKDLATLNKESLLYKP